MGMAFALVLLSILVVPAAHAGDLPARYMAETESQPIIDKLLHVRLAPDISVLSAAEHDVVRLLISVGEIFDRLHLDMRHHQAIEARTGLLELDHRLGSPTATQNLITLFYSAKGPIVRGLDGERHTILPVDGYTPGRNVYPWGVTRGEIDAYLQKYPEARSWILDARSVVRRGSREDAERDLSTLDAYPTLDALHPGFRAVLQTVLEHPGEYAFYATPYSVAYAEPLTECFRLLMKAASVIESEDGEFAGYLRNRARDLLSDNYESGDASWVTGHFKNLNAQIGAYEVYDDALFGVKAFYGLNVLVRDQVKSEELREAVAGIQAFENSLPYVPNGWTDGDKKQVRSDIPVGVYNVVADFGQSRGANTATILPNQAEYARKYGRTILLRNNIMTNEALFSLKMDTFGAAVAKEHTADLTAEGGFYRTLWHEIGHYLGVDRTRDGRDLDDALEQSSSTYEELKSDLVSVYLAKQLEETGYYTPQRRREVYADGIRRVLLKNRPQRSQPYQTMELMQFNYFLENDLIEYDADHSRLAIHYDRFHDVASQMLEDVFAIQSGGDLGEADAFMDRYTVWDEKVHGALAASMRGAETYRFTYVTYEALEPDAR